MHQPLELKPPIAAQVVLETGVKGTSPGTLCYYVNHKTKASQFNRVLAPSRPGRGLERQDSSSTSSGGEKYCMDWTNNPATPTRGESRTSLTDLEKSPSGLLPGLAEPGHSLIGEVTLFGARERFTGVRPDNSLSVESPAIPLASVCLRKQGRSCGVPWVQLVFLPGQDVEQMGFVSREELFLPVAAWNSRRTACGKCFLLGRTGFVLVLKES
ncbi:hypothetical protein RRG08_057196 [Elysia crispata]|uniref:Uncharacterized protein n=1 Tax=Elysia crispata TaxID=231223 RepID=A0AAE0XX00_9GAST|nr:hypothetical protein RRG08_057196 [Elysia crispata]